VKGNATRTLKYNGFFGAEPGMVVESFETIKKGGKRL